MLANSGIASLLVLAVWRLAGWEDKCLDGKESAVITSLIGGIIGHYSSCNGDTWSSELGVLSDAQPRLITTFKVDGYLLFFTHTHTLFSGNLKKKITSQQEDSTKWIKQRLRVGGWLQIQSVFLLYYNGFSSCRFSFSLAFT